MAAVIYSGDFVKALSNKGYMFKNGRKILGIEVNPMSTATNANIGDLLISSYGTFQKVTTSATDTNWIKLTPQDTKEVDILYMEKFSGALLSDFTQSGLSFVNQGSNAVASLGHTSASYLRKDITVLEKWQGKNNTLKLYAASTATSGNLTITVYDITNSKTLATGNVNISGSLSQYLRTQISFDIPSNCTQIYYKVDGLIESGKTSYIDDIQIYLTEVAKTSTSVTVPVIQSDIIAYEGLSGNDGSNRIKFTTLTTSSNGNILTGDNTSTYTKITVNKSSKVTVSVSSFVSASAGMSINQYSSSGTLKTSNAGSSINSSWDGSLTSSYQCAAGDYFLILSASVPTNAGHGRLSVYAVTDDSTTSQTIPLTSSVLVTQPDSSLRIGGFGFAVGSTATKILSLTSGTIKENIGTAIQYLDDSVNGARFIAQQEGMYRFSISFDQSDNNSVGFSKNSQNLTTIWPSIPESEKFGHWAGDTGDVLLSVAEGYLKVGDVIRIHNSGVSGASTTYSQFTASYIGSTKIINPSSDQKIEIPTHELRFEGASSRGSTDTAIVKFDTMAKIRGDAWDVVNTAANGTVITMKKAGRLNVYAANYTSAAGSDMYITKNQSNLTSYLPTIGEEIIASSSINAINSIQEAVGFVDVVVGDKIRVSGWSNPTNGVRNQFRLSLQETSVAVALQNVTPQWDTSDSNILLTGDAGNGSTGTCIQRFSNLVTNLGSDVSYFDDAVNGAYFKINTSGIYNLMYMRSISGTGSNITMGFSKNASGADLSTAIQSLTPPKFLSAANVTLSTGDYGQPANWTGYLQKDDIIRAHHGGSALGTVRTTFSISKVGKTAGTVDVTPFVQIPQNDVEAISATGLETALADANNEVQFASFNQFTNKGIIRIDQDSANTRTKFTVLKDCELKISWAATVAGITDYTYISKNGNIVQVGSTAYTSSRFSSCSAPLTLIAGDFVTVGVTANSTTGSYYLNMTATAQSTSVVSATQQVSSDTMNFVFKSTAIDPNTDAIGTYNTYYKNTSSGVSTLLSSSAPSVLPSSANGFFIYSASYSGSSTATTPSRYDIFIGKGLKGNGRNFIQAFQNAGKSGALDIDFYNYNGGQEFGFRAGYDPSTGILRVDVGWCSSSAVSTRYAALNTDLSAGVQNVYFTIDASKTPSLVAVPQLQTRTAYISDKKTNDGTIGGGSSVSATWTTRTLNTLEDVTGFVTSLSSNQFILPAGEYEIDFWQYLVNSASFSYGSRIYNITDSLVVAVQQGYKGANGADDNKIGTVKRFTITSPKVFSLQYYQSAGFTNYGLGQNVPVAVDGTTTYSSVTITKYK